MDKLMEAFVEDLFKSPAFREKLQLWFTEAIGGCSFIEADDAERICEDMLNSAHVEASINVR